MQAHKRISLNTSLKNARIFEEHSDDEFEPLTFDKLLQQAKEKHRIKIETTEASNRNIETTPNSRQNVDVTPSVRNTRSSTQIKSETTPSIKIKTEQNIDEVLASPKAVSFGLSIVKKERDDDADQCISSAVAEMQLLTPVKGEQDDLAPSKANLKSAKRSLLKQRNSPYAKEVPSTYATRAAAAMRGKEENLYEQLQKTKKNLAGGKKSGVETDPAVLERRQKQIDYGKNTIGYDNYVRNVPRSERKHDDPMTPNKNRIYSRRAFDGLIKQWRLLLHKYDPDQ